MKYWSLMFCFRPYGQHFLRTSVCVLFFSLLLALLKIHELQKPRVIECPEPPTCHPEKAVMKPVVRYYGVQKKARHLDVIKSVFQRIGYDARNDGNDWDVLWSHTYPFGDLQMGMAHLRPHQKVNHFPGTGYITQKANLATFASKYVPKAFIMPDDKEKFLQYSKQNPSAMWVQKSNAHRGIRMSKDLNNFNMDVMGTFIQEYIANPFLIDQRKFDIGVYVTLTSIDPLRVYVYSSDVLIRFCSEKYDTFAPDNFEAYVIGDDYLPLWKVPSLQSCFSKLNHTSKECLNSYLRTQGKNPQSIWLQIHEAIREVYFKAEDVLIKATLPFGSLRNYFELVRFDFVLDENLNVFMLEANMSPNLSSEHFPPNRLLYEKVIFSVLSLSGVTNFLKRLDIREEFEVSSKDIQVYPEDCASETCRTSCKIAKCHVCNQCMTEEHKLVAKTAYLEQMNRKNFHRLIPASVVDLKDATVPKETKEQFTAMNYFMDRWYKGKCLQDVEWCF